MSVKIVTDSTADLPPAVVEELGITVVPLNVRFGDETFRDGVDIDSEEFFRRLIASPSLPTTSQPSAGTFIEVYQRLAAEAEAIVSIHIAQKLSGTINSALAARGMLALSPEATRRGESEAEGVEASWPIEIIDSLSVSMGLGLSVIAAAKAAKAGAALEEVLAVTRHSVERVRTLVLVDTLEYLQKGGRIGRARAFLGTLLNVKPLIKVEEGEIRPVQQVRTRSRALDRLYDFVAGFLVAEDMALMYSTTPDEAEAFAQRLSAIYPRERLHVAPFGPVVGTYTGPGALAVGVRGEDA